MTVLIDPCRHCVRAHTSLRGRRRELRDLNASTPQGSVQISVPKTMSHKGPGLLGERDGHRAGRKCPQWAWSGFWCQKKGSAQNTRQNKAKYQEPTKMGACEAHRSQLRAPNGQSDVSNDISEVVVCNPKCSTDTHQSHCKRRTELSNERPELQTMC